MASESVPTLHLDLDCIGVLIVGTLLEGEWIPDVEGAVELLTVRSRPTFGSSPVPPFFLGGPPLASGFLSTLGIIWLESGIVLSSG
jgi:hypothetical protein